MGTNKLSGNGIYYSIDKIISNENYNHPPFAYDIVLLRVKGTIEFNDRVHPIRLSSDEVPEGSIGQLTGWGLLSVEIFL